MNNRGKSDRRIVDTIISDHFEMFVWDMNNETLDKINSRNSFDDELVVFVSIIMKSDMGTGIRIDTRRSNDRSTEITSNVLGNGGRIAVIRLSVNIEALAMILIDVRFHFFEGSAKFFMKLIQ